jgi:hypothetical protein
MAIDLSELERLSRELGGARSALDDRLGITYVEATAERVVARMPVDGNTQVYGMPHGGASCVLRDRPDESASVSERVVVGEQLGIATVVAALASCGANAMPHPGGTLLAHLERVHALLDEWGARPVVRLAGLCHAYYGTDGFPTTLGDTAQRDELAAIIGEEAERLVYLYAGCDRGFSYPHVAEPDGPFKDRFSGTVLFPPLPLRRDFAELTAANELDIMRVNSELRAQHGPGLLRLFTSWRRLLSDPAWRAVRMTLQ